MTILTKEYLVDQIEKTEKILVEHASIYTEDEMGRYKKQVLVMQMALAHFDCSTRQAGERGGR